MKRWSRRNLPTVVFLTALVLLAALILVVVTMTTEAIDQPAEAATEKAPEQIMVQNKVAFDEADYQSRLEAEAYAPVEHEAVVTVSAATYDLPATEPESEVNTEPEIKPDEVPCGKGGFVDSRDKREWGLLAITCYREAGGDECCNLCRYRVCDVALTRRDDPRYPDTLEGVLTEPLQYGLLSITGVVWPERASDPEEAEAVARAWAVAEDVLSGNHSDLWGKGYIFQAEFPQGDLDGRIYCEQCNMWYGKG